MWFKAYHEFDHGKSVDASNYQAKISMETCSGCGLCAKRCPMEAIELKASEKADNKTGKGAVVDQEDCIGCGVCAFKCPTDSIVLERRDQITEPPADEKAFVKRIVDSYSDPLPKRQ